jgi:hypothetical protein
MPAGGARPGAGRPKGGHNLISAEARAQALASGITPLDYLLSILRDDKVTRDVRMDAAKAAAPYMHARLASIEHSGQIGVKRADDVSDDVLAHIATGSGDNATAPSLDTSQLN